MSIFACTVRDVWKGTQRTSNTRRLGEGKWSLGSKGDRLFTLGPLVPSAFKARDRYSLFKKCVSALC